MGGPNDTRLDPRRRGSIVGRFLRLFVVLTILGACVFAFVQVGILGRQMPAVQIARLMVDARAREAVSRYLLLRAELAGEAARLRSTDNAALAAFLQEHPVLAEVQAGDSKAVRPARSLASAQLRLAPVTRVARDATTPAAPVSPSPTSQIFVRFDAAALGPVLFPTLPDAGVSDALSTTGDVIVWSQGSPLDSLPKTQIENAFARYAGRLMPLPGADLSVFTEKDISGDPIRTNVLVGITFFATMLVLAAWLAARYVVRPLQALQHGARRMAKGERDVRIDVATHDEVGALAHDFNAMAETVAAREHELEETNAALKRASELKTMFLANVSHELRTPLTAIIGFVDILCDGLKGPVTPEQVALLDKLRGNAKALQLQIDDLLDVSSIEAGGVELTLEQVPIGECLEAAYAAVEPQIRSKGLDFSVDVPQTPVVVTADYRRLVQIFVNILANSVKFTDQGQIRLSVHATNEHAEVSIEDTGEGISPDALPHVFEAFRQGDGGISRKHGGAGLGLAICKTLVEMHGGTITVDSRQGKGTLFVVRLPRSRP